jgi:K+-sensing histidine kinase KdpD
MSILGDTPTLKEYLDMMQQKDELATEAESLEIEIVGRRASVDYLRHIEHDLRSTIATLCYDMSRLLEITGNLADTEKTQLWSQIQDTVKKTDTP